MGGGGGWNRGLLDFEPGVAMPRRSFSLALGSFSFLSLSLACRRLGGGGGGARFLGRNPSCPGFKCTDGRSCSVSFLGGEAWLLACSSRLSALCDFFITGCVFM